MLVHEIRPCRSAAPTAAPSSPPPRTASTRANSWYDPPPPPTVRSRGFEPLARGDVILSMSPQNTSLSSLDDSVDQFDGSESQSSQHQPLQKAHRGQRSRPPFVTQSRSSALTPRPCLVPSLPQCPTPTARPSGASPCSRATPRPRRSCRRQVRSPKRRGGRRVLGRVLTPSPLPPPGSGGSWVWNVTEKAKSLLAQREASTLNTLLFIYLIL